MPATDRSIPQTYEKGSSDPVLMDKVQGELDALMETSDDRPPPPRRAAKTEDVEEEVLDEVVDEEEAPDKEDEASSDSDDDGPEAADEAEEPTAEPSDESPTLPKAHYRSLKGSGWDDEEIAERLASDPEGFAKTAFTVHQIRVKQSNEWAERGRREKETAETVQNGSASEQRDEPTVLKPINTAELEQRYTGHDEALDIISSIAGPANQAIEMVNQMLPQIVQNQEANRAAQESQASQQIDLFFASDGMKPYSDFYGPSFQGASEVQTSNRMAVLEHADRLVVGAGAMGQLVDPVDAMELAHDAVSGEFKATAIRRDIRTTVKKRAKATTLRPRSRGAVSDTGKAKNKTEQVQRAEAGLAALFGN